MPIIVNGTQIVQVNVNNRKMNSVKVNDVEVFKAEKETLETPTNLTCVNGIAYFDSVDRAEHYEFFADDISIGGI